MYITIIFCNSQNIIFLMKDRYFMRGWRTLMFNIIFWDINDCVELSMHLKPTYMMTNSLLLPNASDHLNFTSIWWWLEIFERGGKCLFKIEDWRFILFFCNLQGENYWFYDLNVCRYTDCKLLPLDLLYFNLHIINLVHLLLHHF